MPRVRRGFSLVEAAVVIAVAGLLAAAVTLTVEPGRAASGDAAARTTLETVIDAAEEVRDRYGVLVEDIAVYDARLVGLTLTAETPTADGVVSFAVSGSVVGAAVPLDDGACFLIRRDWGAAPGAPLIVRVVATPDSGEPCTGAAAVAVISRFDGSAGATWDDPLIVTGPAA